jgi:hypothetical protein
MLLQRGVHDGNEEGKQPQIRQRRSEECAERDAPPEARNAEEWQGREGRNGEEPEASDRDRVVGSAEERSEGSTQAHGQKEDDSEAKRSAKAFALARLSSGRSRLEQAARLWCAACSLPPFLAGIPARCHIRASARRSVMHRRELLRVMGAAAVVPVLAPLSPDIQLAIGRALHVRLPGRVLQSLDAHQDATVTRIAEMIIPETDTVGASSVKVHEFVDLLLTEWYSPEQRDRFLTGLADIDARSRQVHGAAFVDLSAGDQNAMLFALDGAEKGPGSAEDAVKTLKQLTIYGYFTSEIVMKDVLHHQIIPGRHDGCVPV